MESSIEIIIKCRKPLNLTKSIYLFPRPNLKTLFDGSKVMREMVALCPNLEKPEFLTANGLRHNVATKGHVKGPVFTHKLSKFMCHSQQVHDKNYVAQVSVVNKGIIEKYLRTLEGTQSESPQNHQENTIETENISVSPPADSSDNLIFVNEQASNLDKDEEFDPTYIPEVVMTDENNEDFYEEDCMVKRPKKRRWTLEEK